MDASSGTTADEGTDRRAPLVILHLMKTGGFSLLYQVLANVTRDAVFGVPEHGVEELAGMATYSSVAAVADLDPAARSRLEVVIGHLPFAVVEVAGLDDAPVAALLRDPVERVVSYLVMCKARNVEHRDLPLEAIYDDVYFGPRLIRNHQTKMLGMTAEQATVAPPNVFEQVLGPLVDVLRDSGYFESPQFREQMNTARFGTDMIDTPLVWPVWVDRSTLDRAMRNLERIDVLGVHERYDDYLAELSRRTGWRLDRGVVVNQGREVAISDSFRRHIEAGNALDRELYERARELAVRRPR